MRKSSALLIISTFLMAMGCKKNSGPSIIKTIQYPISNEIYTYQYSSNGRVNTINGSLGDKTVYIDLGNYITATQYDTYGNVISTTTYFINTQQLADSVAVVAAISYSYKNMYDANGYLISQKQYDANNNLINMITDSIMNGNIITQKGNGTLTLNTFINRNNTIGNANTGLSFMGKDSKNLLGSSNATGPGQTNYSYTYDGEGRVTSSTLNNVTNSSSTTYFYTYY